MENTVESFTNFDPLQTVYISHVPPGKARHSPPDATEDKPGASCREIAVVTPVVIHATPRTNALEAPNESQILPTAARA